jgi:uncharacterized protein YbaR (Trm112 family)
MSSSASRSTAVSEPAPPARLTPERLGFLVCPVCHGGLALGGDSVDCTACGRRFPVVDGLPVLLADRALSSR